MEILRKFYFFLFLSVWIAIGCQNSLAQDLQSIGDENPLTVTGGVSLNQIVYAVNGIASRRDPYSYYASGNVNFNLYGWSVPLSFTYSNQRGSFQQPFNQFGISPTYKWLTGHFGYSSMNFSPYTLAGHLFLGAGVEARPGKWDVSVMYGRLQKAIEPDSLNAQQQNAAFRRMGYGFKIGYRDGSDFMNFIVFRGKDDEHSIAYVPEEQELLPEENLVLSVSGGKQLFERFIVKTEYALSGISRDTRSQEVNIEGYKLFSYVGNLFTPRLSSSFYSAFNTDLTYQANIFTVGVGYERIAPGYRTLGAYYFNNDLENITINATTAIFKGRVNIAANIGTQRDNLDGNKISTMRRMVGSFNLGFTASEKLNISTSYSNFQTYTHIRSQFEDINRLTPYENLDTLNFTQISQNANLNANYILSNTKTSRQNLNLNISFQDAADMQGSIEQHSGTQFYNLNAGYSLGLVPKNITLAAAFNYNKNTSPLMVASALGPTLGIAKTLMERKMRIMLSTSFNSAYTNGQKENTVSNLRANGRYTIDKKHNISISLIVLNRETNNETGPEKFTEFTGTLGYSFNFSTIRSNQQDVKTK